MSTYDQYLATLRRVPDDVILAVATREFDMTDGTTCLCGWVVREALARIANKDAADLTGVAESGETCADLYGGKLEEWREIYTGVMDTPERYDFTFHRPVPNLSNRLPAIEEAFVERVLEAV